MKTDKNLRIPMAEICECLLLEMAEDFDNADRPDLRVSEEFRRKIETLIDEEEKQRNLRLSFHTIRRMVGYAVCILLLLVSLTVLTVEPIRAYLMEVVMSWYDEYAEKLYTGTEYVLPDGWRFGIGFTPAYDASTGITTVYAESSEKMDDLTYRSTGGFFDLHPNGAVIERTTFPLPDNTGLTVGTFTEDAVYTVTLLTHYAAELEDYTFEYAFHCTDLATGEITASMDLSKYFSNLNAPTLLRVDKNGDLYLQGSDKILYLSADLSIVRPVNLPNRPFSITVMADGRIGVCTFFNQKIGIAPIEQGKLGDPYSLTEDARTLLAVPVYEGDYAFYFVDKSNVWGANFGKKQTLKKESLMNLTNSGIVNKVWGQGEEHSEYPVAVLGTEAFLFSRSGTPEKPGVNPVIYRPAEVVLMNDIHTITVAYAEPLPVEISSKIIHFNKTRDDVLVALKDYSIYVTEDDPDAGKDQLAFDIVNKICEPDIVIGWETDPAITEIYEKNLYVDLFPYLKTDDTINTDTVFGAIQRAYDDGRGGLWGITSQFEVRTLLSTKDILGEYGDQTSWTLDEMLDFLESLPSDVYKMPYAMRNVADYQLLSQGYGMFIDRETATCTFDSDLFKRYLNYIVTLPATAKDDPPEAYRHLSTEEKITARYTGNVGLDIFLLAGTGDCSSLISTFGTSDYVPIGFATTTDSGAHIRTCESYVITTFSEHPEICWELIRTFFMEDDFEKLLYGKIHSLKTQTQTVLDYYADREIVCYTDGTGETLLYDPANSRMSEDLDKPGIVVRFDEKEGERLMEYLDTEGNPILHQTPAKVTEIVKEEISAFASGLGTADDCAKKIQTRVSLWLAENQ